MAEGGNRIVVMTGAGISVESGLPAFRGAGGRWNSVPVSDVATPEAFAANPDRVHEFYNERRRQLHSHNVGPNAAHIALSRLQAEWPGTVVVATQNIDDLHEKAGTEEVIHLHGELLRARCLSCLRRPSWTGDMDTRTACSDCGTVGGLRPDVVWFGELVPRMGELDRVLNVCDIFVTIGTSNRVYRAERFLELLPPGCRSVALNLEPTLGHSRFTETRYGPATQVVPSFVDELLSG